jgi:hypothetical protein
MGSGGVIRPLLLPRAGVGRPRIVDRLVVNGILYVFLLLDAVGCIYPLSTAHTRHAGVGLGVGVLWACGLRFFRPYFSKLSHKARSRYSSALQSFPDIEGAERSIG